MYVFHGGCRDCTQQEVTGSTEVCKGCQYLAPNWDLPDLNNRPLTPSEIEKKRLCSDCLEVKNIVTNVPSSISWLSIVILVILMGVLVATILSTS